MLGRDVLETRRKNMLEISVSTTNKQQINKMFVQLHSSPASTLKIFIPEKEMHTQHFMKT